MILRILLAGLLLFTTCVLASDNIINTEIRNTSSQNSETAITLDIAKEWNLDNTEWTEYQTLMQGPGGYYYKKLSPPEVLGINAKTPEETRHFAEIAAQQEHDRLEQELRFNAAFHEAAQRLYASEPLIRPFDITPFTPIPDNHS